MQQLKQLISGHGLRARLLRGGVGSLSVKLASIGLRLAMAVVLARLLGVSGFGVYSFVLSFVMLLGIPFSYGLSTLVVRETAKAQANEQWSAMRGVWRWASWAIVIGALFVALVAGGVAWAFAEHLTTLQIATFWWGLAFIPALAFGKLCGGVLRGLRHVVLGQLPEEVIRPALLVVFVGAFAYFAHGQVSADQAMAFNVLAAVIGVLVAGWLLQRSKPTAVTANNSREYYSKPWLQAILPLAFIGGMQFINMQIDIIMLGVLSDARAAGLFRVASRGAELVMFSLMAIRLVVQPYFARFYAQQELKRLERLATLASLATVALAVPAVVVFIFFGSTIISTVFGSEFVGAYSALVILSVFKLAGAGFGAIGLLLVMSGHERDIAKITAGSAICNIVLNAILIPLYGMNGAAIATGSTFLGRRLVTWWLVRRRLGFDGSALNLRMLRTA